MFKQLVSVVLGKFADRMRYKKIQYIITNYKQTTQYQGADRMLYNASTSLTDKVDSQGRILLFLQHLLQNRWKKFTSKLTQINSY